MPVTLSAANPIDCVRVPIVNDVTRDPDELFQVVLSTSFASVVVRPSLASAQVSIIDNDEGKPLTQTHMLSHTHITKTYVTKFNFS